MEQLKSDAEPYKKATPSRVRHTEADWAEAREWYFIQKLNMPEVAELVGISRHTLYKRARVERWAERRKSGDFTLDDFRTKDERVERLRKEEAQILVERKKAAKGEERVAVERVTNAAVMEKEAILKREQKVIQFLEKSIDVGERLSIKLNRFIEDIETGAGEGEAISSMQVRNLKDLVASWGVLVKTTKECADLGKRGNATGATGVGQLALQVVSNINVGN